MGGKQKQAQRTKGNVRPSSSARAAEMLSAGGSGGFIGFSSLSGELGYVPAATPSGEDADSSVDPDFRLVLRKLSKKDATTKLKALQELCTLCQEKDTETIKIMLPYWPRIYTRVSIDTDRRVREAAQQALHQMASRVHRSLAPHLRSLMGPWLVAQADPYAPSASSAKKAFLSAFPPVKQDDAVAYCKEDVMEYLQEHLLVHTAQTLSDPKTTDMDDMEAKFLRVIASSLSALTFLIASVAKQHTSFVEEKYGYLLSQGKFWKLAKHDNNQIRAAFYSLAGGICQHAPGVAEMYGEKLSCLVLYSLDDTDPVVCGPLWEALLRVITTVKDCWSKVNPRKGVWPKLWVLLRGGGCGVAVTVFPNLLPLLSQIPAAVSGSGLWFYEQFFTNMRMGLSADCVMKSSSEVNALVQAYMECLRYCISQTLTCEWSAWEDFIHDEIYTVVMASLEDERPALATSVLYPMLVDLISFLHKSSSDTEVEGEKSAAATKALKTVINILHTARTTYVESNESKQKTHAVKRFASLLHAFKTPVSVSGMKVSKGVQFADGADSPVSQINEKEAWELPVLVKSSPLLGDFISASCSSSYRHCQDLSSSSHLTLYASIVQDFISDQLLFNLLHEDADQLPASPALAYTQSVIMPWVMSYLDKVHGRDIMTELITICQTVYSFAPAADRCAILSTVLKEATNQTLLHTFLTGVLARKCAPCVRSWFKGAEFGERMVEITSGLCEAMLGEGGSQEDAVQGEEQEASWSLLRLAMSCGDDLELVLGETYMDQILTVVQSSLPSGSQLAKQGAQKVHRCVAFICKLATHLFTSIQGCLSIPAAEKLLFSIFMVDCLPDINLPDNLLRDVGETWQKGVLAYVRQTGGFFSKDYGFLLQFVSHIKLQVSTTVNTVDRLEQLCDVALRLITSIEHGLVSLTGGQSEQEEPLEVIEGLMEGLYMPASYSNPPQQWRSHCVVTGDLLLSSLPEAASYKDYSCLPHCLTSTAFTSHLVAARHRSHKTSHCDIAIVEALLYAQALCQSLVGCRKQALASSELMRLWTRLHTNLHTLTHSWQAAQFTTLAARIISRSLEEGGLWSLSLAVLVDEVKQCHVNLDWMALESLSIDRFGEPTEEVLHTLQVILPHLPCSIRTEIANIKAAQVLSFTPEPVSLTLHTGGSGHMAALTGVLLVQECEGISVESEVVLGVLTQIQSWRDEEEELFLFDSVVETRDWHIISFNMQVTRFITAVVGQYSTDLSASQWDFILCSLVSWLQSCNESSEDLLSDLKTQAFASSTFDLLTKVNHCIETVLPERKEEFPPNLASEWLEFFSEGAFSLILPMFTRIAAGVSGEVSPCEEHLVRHLCQVAALCPQPQLLHHKLPASLVAGQDTHLPDDFLSLLNHLCPLLLSSQRAVQVTAFRMLARVVENLSSFEEDKAKESDEDFRRLPHALLSVLETSGEGVEVILHVTKLGETMLIEPYIEEHVLTTGYLLCWQLLLAMFKAASSELRAKYAQFLQTQHYVDALMVNVFRLMPANPIVPLSESLTSSSPSQCLSASRNMFAQSPLLPLLGGASSEELQHMACSVYYQALQDVPAIIRQYCNNQDKNFSRIIDEFTSQYVTPILCQQEISAIQKANYSLDNMKVRGRPAAREVVATYTVEEVTMELIVMLPSNYPLGPIQVETVKRIGVATNEWRNWMLQLTSFLLHQNGSILDGLTLWKKNVDKRFEGVEECMICFAVIHNTTCQLPQLRCSTCKKKFHSACLYKWFNTSNQATCPLCRSLF